jgi:hypothetical protein
VKYSDRDGKSSLNRIEDSFRSGNSFIVMGKFVAGDITGEVSRDVFHTIFIET